MPRVAPTPAVASHPLQPGAVLFAKDLPRMAAFYAGLLSMTQAHAERGLIVLASAQLQLVLHALPKRIAARLEIGSPPVRRTQTPIKLFFIVASLAEARARAPALGGALDPASAEFSARGFRACDGHDPEGNVLQLRQAAP